MTETIPAQYLNEPAVGYVYVALLSENAQNKITELLASLSEDLPGVIWTMPPTALHLTLCEIIQSRKTYSESKDELFNQRREEYFNGPAEVLADIPAFCITLDQIEVSPDAIIVRTKYGTTFNDIRTKLLGRISLPSETKQPPNIIHSSIARYQQAVDIAAVQAAAASNTINIKEQVTEFKLLRTTVPPLIRYEELASFPLKV